MKTPPPAPMGELILSKKMKQPLWLKRCSAPVRLRVEERLQVEGYEQDPDLWLTDLLTTAVRSPQGFVLRFGSLRRGQAKELTERSVADADLFAQQGGGLPMAPELSDP